MQMQQMQLADGFVKKFASKKLAATSDWSEITTYFSTGSETVNEITINGFSQINRLLLR